MKMYQVSLRSDLRPPFRPDDELHADAKDDDEEKDEEKKEKKGNDDGVSPIEIELDGIQQRVWEVPIEPGAYRGLAVNKKALFWMDRGPGSGRSSKLMAAKIDNEKVEPKKIVEGVSFFEMSADGKKLLTRKKDSLYVIDAAVKEASKLDEHKVNLDGWTFAIDVREDMTIIDGERRWRAAQMAGLDEIQIRIVEAVDTDEQIGERIFDSFDAHRQASLGEKVRLYRLACDILKRRHGRPRGRPRK